MCLAHILFLTINYIHKVLTWMMILLKVLEGLPNLGVLGGSVGGRVPLVELLAVLAIILIKSGNRNHACLVFSSV